MKKIKSIGIIGIGKLGESLTDILSLKKMLSFIFIRNKNRKLEINKKYKFHTPDSPKIVQNYNEIPDSFDCLFLTVNDSSIMSVINELINTKIDFSNKFLVHCSGLLPSEVMLPLKEKGAITIAAHPFQTFFNPSGKNFEGIYWGIESTYIEKDIFPFINLIKSFKSNYMILNFSSKEQKALYHLSAVLSSNFISLLLFQAFEVLKKSGIDNIEILKPIVITTINNFFGTKGNEFPITGPAVRADITTLEEHLQTIRGDDQLTGFYKSVTKSIILTAFRKNFMSKDNLEKVLAILSEDIIKTKKN